MWTIISCIWCQKFIGAIWLNKLHTFPVDVRFQNSVSPLISSKRSKVQCRRRGDLPILSAAKLTITSASWTRVTWNGVQSTVLVCFPFTDQPTLHSGLDIRMNLCLSTPVQRGGYPSHGLFYLLQFSCRESHFCLIHRSFYKIKPTIFLLELKQKRTGEFLMVKVAFGLWFLSFSPRNVGILPILPSYLG